MSVKSGDEVLLERIRTTWTQVGTVREIKEEAGLTWLLCDLPSGASVYWPACLTYPATLLREVTIPARVDHQGLYTVRVKLKWVCPVCGKPRGDPHLAYHWNGTHVLECEFWHNECGHDEDYQALRIEAFQNGLNAHLVEGVSIYEHERANDGL